MFAIWGGRESGFWMKGYFLYIYIFYRIDEQFLLHKSICSFELVSITIIPAI
jgi:hypothetical protein